MRDWIKCQTLDRVAVGVLQETLELVRPDDDGLVGTAGSEFLAIPSTGDRVHGVLVAFQCLQQGSGVGVVDEDSLGGCHNQLASIDIEADGVDA